MLIRVKIVFALITMILIFGSAELLIRWTGAAESCPNPTESKLWICDPLLYFKTSPELRVLGEPVNSRGFRAREFERKKPGVFRILSLGDSCTFGITAPDHGMYLKEPYPQLLEQMIAREHGPGLVEVFNGGSPGYNSYQGLLLLRTKMRSLEPDLITVRFGWNDHLMSPHGRIEGAFRESSNPIIRSFKDQILLRTALYSFGSRTLLEARAMFRGDAVGELKPPTEWKPNMSIEEYKYALRRIAELGKARGADVWFLTAPQPFSSEERTARYDRLPQDARGRRILIFSRVTSFDRMREIHNSYIAATREVASELGAPLIDMDAIYQEADDDELFSLMDVAHPTASGHRLEAEALYQRLLDSGTLPRLAAAAKTVRHP